MGVLGVKEEKDRERKAAGKGMEENAKKEEKLGKGVGKREVDKIGNTARS